MSAAPTWRDVEAAKKEAAVGTTVTTLPPGYINGCYLSVTDTNTLEVAIGVVEVAGATVKLKSARNPESSEWNAHQLDDITYYVYIDKGASLHIDILEPAYRADLFGYYHSYDTWRYLGRFVLSGGVVTQVVNQGAVRAEDIEVDSIIASKIQAGAVGTTELADSAVTTAKIIDDAINQAKIANSAVGADQIINEAVQAAKIATAAVTEGKIAANAIVADKIAANAVVSDKILALAVTAAKLASGSVETDKLAAESVTAAKIAASVIATLLLKAGEVWVGFSGTGTWDDPDVGDTRVYIDGDEFSVQIWGGASWGNKLLLGGPDGDITVLGSASLYAAAILTHLQIGGSLDMPFYHVQDQEAANTAGGTFTSGAWQTRTLNTELWSAGVFGALSSNQIILPAGTYYCEFSAPAYHVRCHKTWLYNVTASAGLIIGSSEYCHDSYAVATRSFGSGRFTLASESAIELRHRCSNTEATDGMGVPSNVAIVEVYSDVKIWRIST